MNADFVWFNDQIINKRDILRIYKCSITNKGLDYGIRLILRNAGDIAEWFGEDQSKRNMRFDLLKRLLC